MAEVSLPNSSRRRTRTYDIRDMTGLIAALPPTGSLVATLAGAAPTTGAWLLCDGSTIAAGDYPTLHAMIGGTLPDLTGGAIEGVAVDWLIRT